MLSLTLTLVFLLQTVPAEAFNYESSDIVTDTAETVPDAQLIELAEQNEDAPSYTDLEYEPDLKPSYGREELYSDFLDSDTDSLDYIDRAEAPDVPIASEAIPTGGVSGYYGDNLTWTLTEDGTLTISGSGEMNHYDYGTRPWESYCLEIKKVIIGSNVSSISRSAFFHCENLSSVLFSGASSVTNIDGFAFCGCHKLSTIEIPLSVQKIENYAFCSCRSLTSITIPANVSIIGDNAFENCTELEKIIIDSENTHYTSENGILFNHNKTELIVCPSGTTLKNYTIPSSVTSISDTAFCYCSSIESISIPSSVVHLGLAAFKGCSSLTTMTIPPSISSIEAFTFCLCDKLTSVEIPSSVT